MTTHQSPGDYVWWKHGIIYQIYPRSFQDADGDGIGDLQGVIDRLDYLNDGTPNSLGIDAIWFSPTFPSPMADFGYDVSDYNGVHPTSATLATMDRLIEEAHRRGIRSHPRLRAEPHLAQHPWFVESRSSRDNAEARLVRLARPEARGQPAEQLDRRLRRPGVGVGQQDAAVLPALVPRRAARPQLAQPGGRAGDARRAALLDGARRRRLPHRRHGPRRSRIRSCATIRPSRPVDSCRCSARRRSSGTSTTGTGPRSSTPSAASAPSSTSSPNA